MLLLGCGSAPAESAIPAHKLLYQGHGSLRIVTSEGKVIYIDPYAGEGYDLPADLILVSHGHSDHTAVQLIGKKNDGCQIIYYKDALVNGEYKKYDLGYVTVEAVQAGNQVMGVGVMSLIQGNNLLSSMTAAQAVKNQRELQEEVTAKRINESTAEKLAKATQN